MKLFSSLTASLLILQSVCCVTYLRPKNDRGPGRVCIKCLTLQKIITATLIHFEGATKAGLDCVESVERHFFQNDYSNQIPNLVVYHSKQMASPAMEIKVEYLTGLHERVMHEEEGEVDFQLKVISEVDTKRSVNHISFKDFTLADCYVIIADNLETVHQSIRSISLTASFNEEAKFLILVNDPSNREGGKRMAWEILDTLFAKYRAVNVVVLFATDAFSYDIYTGDPYHGDKVACGKMKALNIGRCTSGKFADHQKTKTELTADKVPLQMQQCVFQVCARVQEPFVNEGCKDGLEIQILHILQEEMGFEINITCSELDRGEIDEATGTWSDLLGKVRDDSCDIIAGAFFPDHEVHADFAATEFYLQDFYTFYIAKAQLAPRWKGLILIFKKWAWAAFGVVLIVSWLFWFAMGIVSREPLQHRQIILTFMNVLAVSLGVSANNRPIYSPLRVFFSFLALYALTITAIYTSKLITVFTHPRLDYQIDSIEELLESGLPIGGRLENMDWFENDDELDGMVFERYNHTYLFRPSTRSLKRIKKGEMAILVSRLFVESNKYRNDVFGLSQSMFANHLEMIVERGFPLLRRINYIISALRDNGLMDKLFIDFNYNMTILTSIREMKQRELRQLNPEEMSAIIADEEQNEDDNPEIVLTVEHLEGAFTILILGLAVSSGVFVLELIFHSRIFRRSVKWIWAKISCSRTPKKEAKRAIQTPAKIQQRSTKLKKFY